MHSQKIWASEDFLEKLCTKLVTKNFKKMDILVHNSPKNNKNIQKIKMKLAILKNLLKMDPTKKMMEEYF